MKGETSNVLVPETSDASRLTFHASCVALEAGDAVSNRILGQVSSGMNVQLLHDTRLMKLHRLHRHLEGRGDRLCAASLSDKLQDLSLARGERHGHRRTSLPGGGLENRVQHILREQRGKIVLSV